MLKTMKYTWFQGKTALWPDAYSVRVSVFIDEQGFSPESENEELDEHCWHIVAIHDGLAAATARIFEGDTAGEWHIGRVAVMPAWRGLGLGRTLMQHAIDRCAELGAQKIVLGAQADKSAFYEGLGFVSTGETYDDEGCPHVMMECKLV